MFPGQVMFHQPRHHAHLGWGEWESRHTSIKSSSIKSSSIKSRPTSTMPSIEGQSKPTRAPAEYVEDTSRPVSTISNGFNGYNRQPRPAVLSEPQYLGQHYSYSSSAGSSGRSSRASRLSWLSGMGGSGNAGRSESRADSTTKRSGGKSRFFKRLFNSE